jgi:hypothetical protein
MNTKYMSSAIYNSPTFRLFKRKSSFIEGASYLFDLSNSESKYNVDITEKEADFRSLASDWAAVGSDMKKAFELYEQELQQPTTTE